MHAYFARVGAKANKPTGLSHVGSENLATLYSRGASSAPRLVLAITPSPEFKL